LNRAANEIEKPEPNACAKVNEKLKFLKFLFFKNIFLPFKNNKGA